MTHGEFWGKVCVLTITFNGRVTSGPRSRLDNKDLGGVEDSLHITGYAADIVLRDWNDKALFTIAAQRLRLTVIDETKDKNHLHLQPAQGA